MNEIPVLAAALIAGVGLGLIYFWGLWMTVKTVPQTRHPALLTFASFGLRTGLCVLVFYVVSGGRWERLLLALMGFVAARTALIRYCRFGTAATGLSKDKDHGDLTG